MKPVNELMASMSNVPSTEPGPAQQLDQGTARVVNSLFKELKSIFPAWKQAWPLDEDLKNAKKSWIKAFMAAGISNLNQIRFGIESCRALGSDFIPSVGKFIQMCQPTPEMLGIPSHDKAYAEAISNAHPSMVGSREWSHQAVYHAASQCGLHALSTMPAEASRKVFDRNYDITIRMLVNGERLRSIPLALPGRVPGRSTPEVGIKALAMLRKSRGGHAHG